MPSKRPKRASHRWWASQRHLVQRYTRIKARKIRFQFGLHPYLLLQQGGQLHHGHMLNCGQAFHPTRGGSQAQAHLRFRRHRQNWHFRLGEALGCDDRSLCWSTHQRRRRGEYLPLHQQKVEWLDQLPRVFAGLSWLQHHRKRWDSDKSVLISI